MHLRSQNLSLRRSGRQILKNVTLSFESEKLYGIIGPNGSGKTSFLKCLARVWEDYKGSSFFEDEALEEKSRIEMSRCITYVSPSPSLLFDFSVEEMVSMGRYPQRKRYESKRRVRQLVKEALERVDAAELAQRQFGELSSGEKQRIYIARALLSEAPALLFDEPTANLDIQHQYDIWELLATLKNEGKIILIATHDLRLASQFCDQLAIFESGECLAFETYQELFESKLLEQVFAVREDCVDTLLGV